MPHARHATVQDGELLSRGHWANARVVRVTVHGRNRVLKTFRDAPWWFRHTLGRILSAREFRVLRALAGIPGIPGGPVRVDPVTIMIDYLPGESMKQLKTAAADPGREFFVALEALVAAMHARGFAHLDLRHSNNVLRGTDGLPVLLDFQSSIRLRGLPGPVQRLLRAIDRSGVAKWWRRLSPGTFDGERREDLRRYDAWRWLWPFHGYPLRHLRGQRRRDRVGASG